MEIDWFASIFVMIILHLASIYFSYLANNDDN